MRELKPCPFCGSEKVQLVIDANVLARVKCDECGASTSGVDFYQSISGIRYSVEETLDSVAELWNKRA